MDQASLRRPIRSLLVAFILLIASTSALITDQNEAERFLEELDPSYLRAANQQMKVRWKSITNVTDENSQAEVSDA